MSVKSSTGVPQRGASEYGRTIGRLRRSDLESKYFHVYSRGIDEIGPIFRDDEDRETFVDLVWRAAPRHGWICHAFCLLGTHYHLVLETHQTSLSSGLHRLNWLYAMYFNTKHDRAGHLFANRFAARAIEREEYLYDACTYVLLNPVRASLCERVEDWRWSYSRYGLAAS